MSHPANAIQVEGRTLSEAVTAAAAQLGADTSIVEHEIDISHFRTPEGMSRGVDTVRIFAWARNPAEVQGAIDARDWLAGLLEHMGLGSEVMATVSSPKVADIKVNSEHARHLVGRQGVTLRAIEDVLGAVMARTRPDWSFRIDITGGARDEDRGDRGDRGRRGRDDRGRDDRGRDDRGGRGERGERPRRGRDDRGGRGDRERRDDRHDDRRTERDAEKLRQLAQRLAQQVLETGETVQIRRQLNSFERRVVHMAVAEVQGVLTESIGEGPERNVVIRPATADEA